MPKFIKNKTAATRSYQGREVLASSFFEIPANLASEYAMDDLLIADISAGLVAMSSDGVNEIAGVSRQVDFLKSLEITQRDSDGANIVRTKTTRTGWHYEPRSLDFITAKHGSLYNRTHLGNTIDDSPDYGDAVLTFWDASGSQLVKGVSESDEDFQARLDSSCVRTHADWQPNYEMDIIGATVSVLNPPTGSERAYAWVIVAPDIPAQFGGSVPFMAGGWNLRFFTLDQTTFLDGRGVKSFTYDPVNNSNKMRVVVKHAAGAKIELQLVAEHFKA
jgi:hypothetical protein